MPVRRFAGRGEALARFEIYACGLDEGHVRVLALAGDYVATVRRILMAPSSDGVLGPP